MGFLRKLFGGSDRNSAPVDKNGIYLYIRSKRAADAVSKVRIDKKYDLNSSDGGYKWHKTIVDAKYFSRIQAVVEFDRNYQVVGQDLDGGEFITAEEYEAIMAERKAARENSDPDVAE